MRLIDIDDLVEAHYAACENDHSKSFETWSLELMKNAPTIDAVPVKHGHWVEIKLPIKTEYECSVCHKHDSKSTAIRGHYCWNCGAKMDEVSE